MEYSAWIKNNGRATSEGLYRLHFGHFGDTFRFLAYYSLMPSYDRDFLRKNDIFFGSCIHINDRLLHTHIA
jgi:hypothetical protein